MAQVRSNYTSGGLSFFDASSALDAMWRHVPHPALIPPSVGFGEVNHFTDLPIDDTTGLPTGWTATVVDVGAGATTIALASKIGGWLRIEAAGNEDDGAQIQKHGLMYQPTATNKLWFGARVLLDEATQSDGFIGLAATDTTVLASDAAVYIGFAKNDGDANWDFVSNDTAETEVAAVATAVAATAVNLDFAWDGPAGTITPYINGVAGTAISTAADVPVGAADYMRLSFAYLNGAAQSAKGLEVDYYRIVQLY